MGIFSRGENREQEKINRLICDFAQDKDTSEEIIKKLYILFDNDLELTKFVVQKFENNRYDVDSYYSYVVNFYNLIDNKSIFKEFILEFVNKPNLFKINIEQLLTIFSDKKIVVDIMNVINNNEDLLENTDNESLNMLIEYVIEARQYYVDERALLSSLITLIKNIDPTLLKYGENKKIKKEINKKLIEDKKLCGIYSIDQFTLSEVDRKLNELGIVSEKLSTLVSSADEQIKILRESLELNKSELNKAKLQELESLRTETLKIIKEFNEKYLELLNQERQSLINEKEQILSEINGDIQKRITDLTNMGNTVASRVSQEIARIRTASNDSIIQMNDFLANNENVRKMILESNGNEEILSKFQRLDEITSQLSTPVSAIPGVITDIPSILLPSEKVDNKVNYYFDESVPFKTRFEKLMELKLKDIEENGAIYHEKFDDVLTMILENRTPYMYGPSGCGKTFMIESQIAKLLGLNVTTNGYVLYEQDILGYTNSGNGIYVPSNFYRCYKFGNIIFFDELDNGIANATVVLNRFIGGNSGDIYVFPNGEALGRHPNFRIVSAGNTKGSGKTLTYNTRQKMDESVMQRVTPIEVNYDNRIEERILGDYPGWYNFAVCFRKAIEKINNNSGENVNSIGTFTTRDAATVKKYLDDGSFSDEQILTYEIIENKDEDYLNKITKNMEKLEESGEFTKEGEKILRLYKGIVKRN